jgi:ankyrin repeat protein
LDNFHSTASTAASKRAQRLFECVANAARPLSPSELAEVLYVDFEPKGSAILRSQVRISDPSDLLSCCPELIEIAHIPNDDHGTSPIVRFVHSSALEFLRSENLSGDLVSYSVNETAAHITIAKVALSTLLSQSPLSSLPFSKYAISSWTEHIFAGAVSEAVDELLVQLLRPESPSFRAWIQARDIDAEHNSSPLYWAAYLGLCEHAQRLVVLDGTDLDALAGLHGTALSVASRNGHFSMTCLLITHRARINVHNTAFYDWSALDYASSGNHKGIVLQLLENGADANSRSADNWVPLHLAAGNGHAEVCRMLLDHGAGVDACNNATATPLHIAAQNGHAEVCRMLLDHGASIGARFKTGATPLLIAAENGHVELSRMLLDLGAHVEARDYYERTPMHAAAVGGHAHVLRDLLAHGGAVDACDKDGSTPLGYAAMLGQADAVCILLDSDAILEVRDQAGWTPLLGAASKGRSAVVRLLLNRGADHELRSHTGRTVLTYAASQGHVGVVRALLDHHARVAAADADGFCALDYACAAGHADVVRLLLAHDAGAHAENPPHGSYRDIAARARRAAAMRPVPHLWSRVETARTGNLADVASVLEEDRPVVGQVQRMMRHVRRAHSWSL